MNEQCPRRTLTDVLTASRALGSLFGIAVIVALWYIASLHELVPTPHSTIVAIVRQFTSFGLAEHFLWTMRAMLNGFAVGAAIGIVLGLALGASSLLRALFAEPIYGLASVPKLILYPIIIAVFSIGAVSQVAFVALSCTFLVLLNTMTATQEISSIHRKLGRAFSLNWWQVVRKIYLPSIAPSLVTGLRLGFSMALVHAVLAEMAIGNTGLGTQVWATYQAFDLPALYGIVFLVTAVGVLGNALLWYLEDWLRGGSGRGAINEGVM